jgi:hypothetical protein
LFDLDLVILKYTIGKPEAMSKTGSRRQALSGFGKRALSISLVLALALASVAFASEMIDSESSEGAHAETSGVCGDGVFWILMGDTIYIQFTGDGTGVMNDFASDGKGSAPWMCYRDCIRHVVIEDGVQNIGSFAFQRCSNIEDISLGDSVTSIGYAAFEDCTSLRSLVIPDSVEVICSNAFYNCTSLTDIEFGNGLRTICSWAFYNVAIEKLILGNNVETVEDYAFNMCINVSFIIIPDSVKTIGNAAIDIGYAIYYLYVGKAVEFIGYGNFGFAEYYDKDGNLMEVTAESFRGHTFLGIPGDGYYLFAQLHMISFEPIIPPQTNGPVIDPLNKRLPVSI